LQVNGIIPLNWAGWTCQICWAVKPIWSGQIQPT
jgi:hypothetical protein